MRAPGCLTPEAGEDCGGSLMTIAQTIEEIRHTPLSAEAGPRYGADTEILHRYPDCHLEL